MEDTTRGSRARRRSEPKRPYQRPAIVHRQKLEITAAECNFAGAKNSPLDPNCNVGTLS